MQHGERNNHSLRFWDDLRDKGRQEEIAEMRPKSYGAESNSGAQQPLGETRGSPLFDLEWLDEGSQLPGSLRLRRREGKGIANGCSNINWSCSLPFHSRSDEEKEEDA